MSLAATTNNEHSNDKFVICMHCRFVSISLYIHRNKKNPTEYRIRILILVMTARQHTEHVQSCLFPQTQMYNTKIECMYLRHLLNNTDICLLYKIKERTRRLNNVINKMEKKNN